MTPPVTCAICRSLEMTPREERYGDTLELRCTHGLLLESMPFEVFFLSIEEAAVFGCIYGEPREGDLQLLGD